MKYAKILLMAIMLWLAGAMSASAQSSQLWSASLTATGGCLGQGGVIKRIVFVAIFPGDGVVISTDISFANDKIIGVLDFVDVIQTTLKGGVFSAVELEGDTNGITFVEVGTGSVKIGKTGDIAGFTAVLQAVENGCFFGGTLKSSKLLATQ